MLLTHESIALCVVYIFVCLEADFALTEEGRAKLPSLLRVLWMSRIRLLAPWRRFLRRQPPGRGKQLPIQRLASQELLAHLQDHQHQQVYI
jgi:hypothetical protein